MAVGVIIPANLVNLSLSADDTGEAIMPPGMIMTNDTPGEAMKEMAAVDPRDISYRAPPDAPGGQPFAPRIEKGVKVYDLTASVIQWHILNNEAVAAFAFSRQVPGPLVHVTQGDRLRINVKNDLPEATTVHWHGLIVPNEMDAPADTTQKPIEPGQTFTYAFTVEQAGTYFYHSHKEPDRQQALGLYGALIVDPADRSRDAAYRYDQDVVIMLQEWLEREGYTYPAMLMEGGLPNLFTINGKAYPTPTPSG